MTSPHTLSWMWLSSGVLVVTGSVAACLAYQRRHRSPAGVYLLGALGWLGSVALKVLAAVLLFSALRRVWPGGIPWPVAQAATGLLTGVLECGFVLLLARGTFLGKAPWTQALGFGLAFGCFEAFILGLFALGRGVLGFSLPLLEGLLSPEELRQVAGSLGAWYEPLVLIFDRAVAVPVHVLTCALVLRSIRPGREGLFWTAFWFKSAVDAVPSQGLPVLVPEALWLLAAFAAAWGLRRIGPWEDGAP